MIRLLIKKKAIAERTANYFLCSPPFLQWLNIFDGDIRADGIDLS